MNASSPGSLPELLFARRVCYAPCYSRNWHAIPEHQIFHIFRGSMTLELASGMCYEGRAGDTLFLPAHVRHLDKFAGPEGPELLHLRFFWRGPENFFTAPPDRVRELAGHAAVIGKVFAGEPGVVAPDGRGLLTGKTGYEHGKH